MSWKEIIPKARYRGGGSSTRPFSEERYFPKTRIDIETLYDSIIYWKNHGNHRPNADISLTNFTIGGEKRKLIGIQWHYRGLARGHPVPPIFITRGENGESTFMGEVGKYDLRLLENQAYIICSILSEAKILHAKFRSRRISEHPPMDVKE
jgi:hypothetical protein